MPIERRKVAKKATSKTKTKSVVVPAEYDDMDRFVSDVEAVCKKHGIAAYVAACQRDGWEGVSFSLREGTTDNEKHCIHGAAMKFVMNQLRN